MHDPFDSKNPCLVLLTKIISMQFHPCLALEFQGALASTAIQWGPTFSHFSVSSPHPLPCRSSLPFPPDLDNSPNTLPSTWLSSLATKILLLHRLPARFLWSLLLF
jgi:hypothetical protein